MTSKRRVEQKTDDGEWKVTTIQELHKGDIFRMFEPDDGAPVKDIQGATEFIAGSEPYQVSHTTDLSGNLIIGPLWGISVVANPGF